MSNSSAELLYRTETDKQRGTTLECSKLIDEIYLQGRSYVVGKSVAEK